MPAEAVRCDMPSFKMEERASLKDSEVCGNPLCDVRFEQTGMAIKPRRFCRDECRMRAWIIRKAAQLLSGLPDATVIEILRNPILR
jgi:hypothetical protein